MSGRIFEQEKTPTPCTWHLGTTDPDPHQHRPVPAPKLIYDDVLEMIGNTPMVRINNITKKDGIQCEILAKVEFLNPGGSVKDRIGYRMLQDAEEAGRVTPGRTTIIEGTSGNTGIGLALACAVRGYRCLITLPEKMSAEKANTLTSLGAEVIRTPTEAAFDSPESHLGVATRLLNEIPDSVILDQYSNPSNSMAHYDGTAEEIITQCEGKLDYLIVTAGTGGTIAGIARKFKERLPNVHIVGVDPHGSILAQPDSLNGPIGTYKVEGIGYDFLPRVCHRESVDSWIKTNDQDSLVMARRLIREEGLLAGGSSGSAMWAAMEIARNLPAGKRVVVLLPDSVRNYLTKFINDAWMYDSGFLPANVSGMGGEGHTLAQMQLRVVDGVSPDTTCAQALERMNAGGYHQLAVFDGATLLGAVTMSLISQKLVQKKITPADPVRKFLLKNVKVVPSTLQVPELQPLFTIHEFVLVQSEDRYLIATTRDLANYLVANQ